MKVPTLVFILFLFTAASCRNVHTCTCRVEDPATGQTSIYSSQEVNGDRRNALNQCQALEAQYSSSVQRVWCNI